MAAVRKGTNLDAVSARIARIRETTIFAGLDDKACAELAAISHFRTLRKGTVLWKQGSHAYELAFVWEGALGVVRQGGDERVGYRIVSINETIGFSNAMGRIPCSVDVIAHEATRVLLFPGDTLRGLVPSHPEIAFGAIAYLGELVASLSDEIEHLHSDSLEDRVLARLRKHAKGRREVVITHAELASQVAARRETITRLLATLEARGLVTLARGRITVNR